MDEKILEILRKIKKDSYISKFIPLFLGLWAENYNIKKEQFGDPLIGELFELIYPCRNKIDHFHFCALMIKASLSNVDLLDCWISLGVPLKSLVKNDTLTT